MTKKFRYEEFLIALDRAIGISKKTQQDNNLDYYIKEIDFKMPCYLRIMNGEIYLFLGGKNLRTNSKFKISYAYE